MYIESRNEDYEIFQYLKKKNFQPIPAISLIKRSIEEVKSGEMLDKYRASFIANLENALNKLLKRQYSAESKEIINEVFGLMIDVIELCQDFEFMPSEKGRILCTLLDSSSFFFKSDKNPFGDSEEFKAKAEGLIDIFIPGMSTNCFYPIILNHFWETEKITNLENLIGKKTLLEAVFSVFYILKQLKREVFYKPWHKKSNGFAQHLISIISNLKSEQLKFITKESLNTFYQRFEDFCRTLMSDSDSAEVLEKLELEVIFNLLESQYLEKKFLGVENLNRKVWQIKRKEELKSISPHSQIGEKPTKYLTGHLLAEWVGSKKLLQLVYSGSFHVEAIKKFSDILKYLYTIQRVPGEIIEMIWYNGLTKHKTYREVHLDTIYDLIFTFSSKDLLLVKQKIEELELSQIDLHVLKILKQFNYLTHKFESSFSSGENRGVYSYLDILWELSQEDVLDRRVSKDINLKAISYFSDSIKSNVVRHLRMDYAEKCILMIKNSKNIESLFDILKSILESYPVYQDIRIENMTKSQALEKLQKPLILVLIEKILKSKLQFTESYPVLLSSYKSQISSIFYFFKYCLKIKNTFLDSNRFQKLWEIFVISRTCPEESDLFFQFLSSLALDKPVIPERQIISFFSDYLLRLNPYSLTISSFKCFERYFLKINKIYNHVTLDDTDFLITVNDRSLIALESLWTIVLTCSSDVVFTESSLLLKRIYRSQKSFTLSEQKTFIQKCFSNLTSQPDGSNQTSKALRSLQLISDFFKLCDSPYLKTDQQSQQQSFEINVTVKYYSFKTNSKNEIKESFYNTTPWLSAKEVISERLGKNMNKLSFSVDDKIIWGENNKCLEDLHIDKFREIDVREVENNSSFDEHVAQLKSIFEYIEEDVIRLALQKEGNSLDEAVSLLTNEDLVASLRSQVCKEKSPATVAIVSEGKPEIYSYIAQNQEFLSALLEVSKLDEHVCIKVSELLSEIPFNKDFKSKIQHMSNLEEIFNSNNQLVLWYSLKIILKLLASKQKASWMEKFFEYGGFISLNEVLFNYENYGINPSYYFSEEVLRMIMEIEIIFIKNFFANSNFYLEELLNLTELISTLLNFISKALSSHHSSEGMIESALVLLTETASLKTEHQQVIYKNEIIQELIVKILPNSLQQTLRNKIVDTIRTFILALGLECSQFFWDLMSVEMPKSGSPYIKEYFFALSIVLETGPKVSQSFIDSSLLFIIERKISEETEQDYLLTCYIDLVSGLLRNFNSQYEVKLMSFIYSCLFDLNTIEDFGKDTDSLPLIKNPETRKSSQILLVLLLQKHQNQNKLVLKKISNLHPIKKLDKLYNYENQVKSTCGFVGLRNFGCTCYLNSVLQQLFMIEDFQSNIFSSPLNSAENLEENILYQMQVIIANLKHSKKQCFEPSDFCKAFKDFEGQSIDVRVQQDADEFLNLLFDKLEESLKLTSNGDLIRSVIGGNLVHEIKSTESEFPYVGSREEHFFRISLDIRNLKNLEAAFNSYVAEEVLEGDNKYLCEEYNTKVNATKRCVLGNLCNTIVVHLKRFEFDYQEMKKNKINDRFEFPVELNLKKWCLDDSQNEEYYQYELAGVVIHSGIADSGHYFSLIKDRKSLKWLKFDDRYVQQYDFSQIQIDCWGKDQSSNLLEFESMSNAYILVYERKKFLQVNFNLSLTGVDVKKMTENQVILENIEFLQDLISFEESYEGFLLDVVRLSAVSDKEESVGLVEHRTLALEDFQVSTTVQEIKSLLNKKNKEDGISAKIIKGAFIFLFELLFKAEKTERFLKSFSVISQYFREDLGLMSWALDLFRFNKVLFFTVMNSVSNEKVKSLVMDFLMDGVKQLLINNENILCKGVVVSDSIETADPLSNASLYAERIYLNSGSRFFDYLMNSGIHSIKLIFHIEETLFNAIEELSNDRYAKNLLITTNSISFLFNLYNSPVNRNLHRIHNILKNILEALISTDLSDCQDSLLIQSSQFSEYLIKNLTFYRDLIPMLVQKSQNLNSQLFEGLFKSFMHSQHSPLNNWQILDYIKGLIFSSDKKRNLKTVFCLKFGLIDKVSFFEDVLMSLHYSVVTKCLIVIWWGEIMQDEDALAISRENPKYFSAVAKVKPDKYIAENLNRLGISDPIKKIEEAQTIVRNFNTSS